MVKNATLLLIPLSIGLMLSGNSLRAQTALPKGMIEVFAGLRASNSNQSILVGDPYLDAFRLESSALWGLSRHWMVGAGGALSFGRSLQFHRATAHLRFYPTGLDRPLTFFGQLSPGMAWTQIRLWVAPNQPDEVYQDAWFHPRFSVGGIWRPQLGSAALEVRLEHEPGYEKGPFQVHRINKLSLRIGFSYWFGTSTPSP
jgi:hypothetical protein